MPAYSKAIIQTRKTNIVAARAARPNRRKPDEVGVVAHRRRQPREGGFSASMSVFERLQPAEQHATRVQTQIGRQARQRTERVHTSDGRIRARASAQHGECQSEQVRCRKALSMTYLAACPAETCATAHGARESQGHGAVQNTKRFIEQPQHPQQLMLAPLAGERIVSTHVLPENNIGNSGHADESADDTRPALRSETQPSNVSVSTACVSFLPIR